MDRSFCKLHALPLARLAPEGICHSTDTQATSQNWLGFFITFLSAYAAAPLIPIIRDSIHLYQFEANLAGALSLGMQPARACMRFLT